MSNTLINIGVPCIILNAAVDVEPGDVFALPSRACVMGWQTSFDENPSTVSLALEIAMEEVGPWTSLDTSTTVTPALRTISTPTAARFIRANIVDNDDDAEVTIELICKVP